MAEKQTWAMIFTGIVLIWYKWEVMLLRRVANVQREQQLRPFIILRKEENLYFVENIGKSAAINIRFKNIVMEIPGAKLEIMFPTALPFLKAGASAEVKIAVKVNGKMSEVAYADHFDPDYEIEDVEVHIHFCNLENKEFSLVEVVSPRTLSIKGFRDQSTL